MSYNNILAENNVPLSVPEINVPAPLSPQATNDMLTQQTVDNMSRSMLQVPQSDVIGEYDSHLDKRYNNPLNPYSTYRDTETAYSKAANPITDQLWNGFKQFVALTGSQLLNTWYQPIRDAKALMPGSKGVDELYKDDVTKMASDTSRDIVDKYPVYLDNSGGTWNNTKNWFKVNLPQAGFMAGTSLGIVSMDMAAAFLTPETGGASDVVAAASTVKNVSMLGKVGKIFDDLYSTYSNVGRASKYLKYVPEAFQSLENLGQATKGLVLLSTAIGSEANIEAYQYNQTAIKTLTDQYIKVNGKDPDAGAQKDIENDAASYAQKVYGLNAVLLGATDFLQLASWVKPIGALSEGLEKLTADSSLKLINGVIEAVPRSLPRRMLNTQLKAASEAFEEYGQQVFQDAVGDQMYAKHNPTVKGLSTDLTVNLAKDFISTMDSQAGKDNAKAGYLMGLIGDFGVRGLQKIAYKKGSTNSFRQGTITQQVIDRGEQLNKINQEIGSQGFTLNEAYKAHLDYHNLLKVQQAQAVSEGDIKTAKDLEVKSKLGWAALAVNMGNKEMWKDFLETMGHSSNEELAKNTPFGDAITNEFNVKKFTEDMINHMEIYDSYKKETKNQVRKNLGNRYAMDDPMHSFEEHAINKVAELGSLYELTGQRMEKFKLENDQNLPFMTDEAFSSFFNKDIRVQKIRELETIIKSNDKLSEGTTLTPDAKKNRAYYQTQLDILKRVHTNNEAKQANSDFSYKFTDSVNSLKQETIPGDKGTLDNYKKLLNEDYNKYVQNEADYFNVPNVKRSKIDEHFNNGQDLLKLYDDHKKYLKAYNYMTNPEYFVKLQGALVSLRDKEVKLVEEIKKREVVKTKVENIIQDIPEQGFEEVIPNTLTQDEKDNNAQDSEEEIIHDNQDIKFRTERVGVNKLISPYSLAYKAVQYVIDSAGNIHDKFNSQGELMFEPGYNPANEFLKPGQKVVIRLGKNTQDINALMDSQVEIEADIYEGDKIVSTVFIALPDGDTGLNKRLVDNENKEALIQEFTEWRSQLIQEFKKNKDYTLESKIIYPLANGDETETGWGYVNEGDKDSFDTLEEKLGNNLQSESNPLGFQITYIGDGGKINTELNTENGPMKAGRVVAVLPNMIHGAVKWIAFNLRTNRLNVDHEISDTVYNIMHKYLSEPNKDIRGKIRQELEKYVMVHTYNKDKRARLGKLELNPEEGNLYFSIRNVDDTFTKIDLASIEANKEIIGNLYFNLNKNLLKDSNYMKMVMNSKVVTTNIHNNRALAPGKFSYFSQHTVVFDKPNVLNQSSQVKADKKSDVDNSIGGNYTSIESINDNSKESDKMISEEDNFKDNHIVSDSRIALIAGKQINNIPLTDFENKIMEDNSSIVLVNNKIIELNDKIQFSNSPEIFIPTGEIEDNINDIPDDEYSAEDISPLVQENIRNYPLNDNLILRNLSLQNAAIESITFNLLGGSKEKTREFFISRKNQVQDSLTNNQQVALKAGKELDQKFESKALQNISDLESIVNNYDALYRFAEDNLKKFNIEASIEGKFESLDDEIDEGVTDQYSQEGNQTRDYMDSMPKEVKKFLSFIPESTTKDGKVVSVVNILGLPKLNNINDTYNKIYEITTQTFYPNNFQAINQMLQQLIDSDIAVLKLVGQKLWIKYNGEESQLDKQLVIKFVNNSNKAYNYYKTLLLNESSEKVTDRFQQTSEFNKLSARMTDTSGGTGLKIIFNNLWNDFLKIAQETKLIFFDHKTNTVNIRKDHAKKLSDKLIEFLSNDNVYYTKYSRYKDSKGDFKVEGKYLSKEHLQTLVDHLYNFGFKLSNENSRSLKIADTLVKSLRSKKFLDDQHNLFTLLYGKRPENINSKLSSIIGTIVNKELRGENEEGEANEESTLFIKDNPFEQETTNINKIVKAINVHKANPISEAFQAFSKSFYANVRNSFITDLFKKLNTEGSPLLYINDTFKQGSQFIQRLALNSQDKYSLFFEKGSRFLGKEVKELKDMQPSEFEITRFQYFLNSGANKPFFMADTYSDKTPKQLFQLFDRVKLKYNTKTGYNLSESDILDKGVDYALAEFKRILKVIEENNNNPQHQKLEGYHDKDSKEGIGKYFVVYPYLNNIRESLIENKDNTQVLKALIKESMQELYQKMIDKTINSWKDLGLLIQDEKGNWNYRDYLSADYLTKWAYDEKNIKEFDENPQTDAFVKRVLSTGLETSAVNQNTLESIFKNIMAEYVINSSLASNEMLTLNGDPAQTPKVRYDGIDGSLLLNESIKKTSEETSKRNAKLGGSGDSGVYYSTHYKVAFAKDLPINSNQFGLYNTLFGDKGKKYKTGDKTDAQEIITLKEGLERLIADGKISAQEYISTLKKYAPIHYEILKRDGYFLNHPHIDHIFKNKILLSKAENQASTLRVSPQKPLHVGAIPINDSLIEIYIKSSAYPLIEGTYKGTAMMDMLMDMYKNKVDRVAFKTGVKQGSLNEQELFDKDGNYNKEFLTNNIVELPSELYKKQLDTDYDEFKSKITEGTQDTTLVLIDILHNYKFADGKSGRELKDEFNEAKRTIFETELNTLLNDFGAEKLPNGEYTFKDLNSLSKLLIDEINSTAKPGDNNEKVLWSLDINPETNQFNVPLTFAQGVKSLEPVITSIFTKRLIKAKFPGKSLIQGAEVMLMGGTNEKVQDKRTVKELSDLKDIADTKGIAEDQRDMIWVDPKHKGKSKLDYIRLINKDNKAELSEAEVKKYLKSINDLSEKEGVELQDLIDELHSKYEVIPAEIVVPFYFLDHNGQMDITKFMTDGVIDLNKIDSELLEIYGFRIPYQSINSGNWFKIVGFLPSIYGDLTIVPGEIAVQMGSDYDVDKLYTYHYHYHYDKTTGKLNKLSKNQSYQEQIDNKKILNNRLKELGISFSDTQGVNEVLEELNLTRDDIKVPSEADQTIAQAHNTLIKLHKEIYTSPLMLKSILEPRETPDVNEAIKLLDKKRSESSEFLGITDPNYQRDVYFDNRGGQIALGIFVTSSLMHAHFQETNDFISTVLKFSRNGTLLKDKVNGNSVNENGEETYSYKEFNPETMQKETQYMSKKEDGIFRFDKIFSFLGKKITQLIAQLTDISVDNAKDKKLNQIGLNIFNANTIATMLHLGLDLDMIALFINQPIMMEFYKEISKSKNMYINNIPLRKEDIMVTVENKFTELLKSYKDEYIPSIGLPTIEFNDLNNNVFQDKVNLNEVQLKQQLEMFRVFQQLEAYSESVQAYTSRNKTNRKGLDKNLIEVSDLARKINEMGSISNKLMNFTDNVKNTLLDTYNKVPGLVDQIFNNTMLNGVRNPIYAYSTDAYSKVLNQLLALSDRDNMTSEQLNDVFNELKRFILTNSSLGLYQNQNIQDVRKRLLTSENNIFNSLERLKNNPKYNNLEIVQVVGIKRSNDLTKIPRLEITTNNKDNYAKIEKSWAIALADDNNIELQQYARDLIDYAFLLGSQEFGYSSFLKHMPLSVYKSMGYGNVMNNINQSLSNEDFLENFFRQYIQHNIDSPLVLNINPKETIVTKDKTTKQIESFILDTIKYPNTKSYVFEGGAPLYLKLYDNVAKKTVLFQKINEDDEYIKLNLLGDGTNSEYSFHSENVDSIYHENTTYVSPIEKEETLEDALLKGQGYDKIVDFLKNPKENTPINKLVSYIFNNIKHSNISIKVSDEKVGALGETFVSRTTGENPRIVIYINEIRDYAESQGKDFNEELMRVAAHELIHAYTLHWLLNNKNHNSKEYKQILEVWNTYRKNIINDNSTQQIRGIASSGIDAALFGAINNLRLNLDPNSSIANKYNKEFINENWDNIYENIKTTIKEFNSSFDLSKNDLKYKDQEEDIKNYILNEIDSKGNIEKYVDELKSKYYSFTKLDEFMTEVISQKETQANIARFDTINKTSFLKQIWNAITDLISNLTDKKDRTLLNDSIESILNLLPTSKNIKIEESNSIENESSKIYDQLGTKTESENVKIVPWSQIKDATSPFTYIKDIIVHIISTRIKDSNEHFGNPFSSDEKVLANNPSLIKTNSTKESVEKYIDWVINSQDKRAEWIREQLKSGKLEGKTILYYTELNEPSHATALDYLINKYDWNKEIDDTPFEGGDPVEKVAEQLPDIIQKKDYKYYGRDYSIILDKGGKGIDVEGYKGKNIDKQKLLDKFNENNNIDPQNGKPIVKDTSNPIINTIDSKYEILPGIEANEQQKIAIDKIRNFLNSKDDVFLLEGRAGVGKTVSINKALEGFNGRIIGSTVSDEARSILQISMKGKVTKTIASLVGLVADESGSTLTFRPRNIIEEKKFRAEGKEDPIETAKLVIIDEASMINTETFNLINKLKPSGTKIIYMGDRTQIPPIGEKLSPVFSDYDKSSNYSNLTKSERFMMDAPIYNITEDIFANNVNKALNGETIPYNPIRDMNEDIISDKESVLFRRMSPNLLSTIVNVFKNSLSKNNLKKIVIVTDRNDIVTNLNKLVREGIFGENAPKFIVGELITFKEALVFNNIVAVENNVKGKVIKVHEDELEGMKVWNLNLTINKVDINGDYKSSEISVKVPQDQIEFNKKVRELAEEAKKRKASGDRFAWLDYFEFKKAFAKIDYGYAMTVHKVQGSGYETVVVNMDDMYRDNNPRTALEINQMMRTATSRATTNLILLSKDYEDKLTDLSGTKSFQDPMVNNRLTGYQNEVKSKNNGILEDSLISQESPVIGSPITTKTTTNQSISDQDSYNQELNNLIQSDLKLDFLSNKELLKLNNSREVKKQQDQIKKKLQQLQKLLKC